MAWSMPTTGQWNASIGMTPDMNMGTYTAEQWALMQQQNWQQWAQWQQQYTQWQSQYGDKYTQEMQAFQAMAGAPPIPPPSAPPPAPPPPDKPPPPPHENDQPLYRNNRKQDTTIQPPGQTHSSAQVASASNNTITTTGNNLNWSYAANIKTEKQESQSVNTEALKKLAEEERLFDIQFKKWEEEIQKWRKENVNHPDKQAYKEYEQKFESCRVQLLERRQQMMLKRARLLGIMSQAANTTSTGNISTPAPPPSQKINKTNCSQNMHPNKQIQNNIPAHNNTVQNIVQYQQFNNINQQGYNRNNNKTVHTKDRYENYQPVKEEYMSPQFGNSNFLPTNQPKEIPGLDLVPELDRTTSKPIDVIDITDDISENKNIPQEPDYSKISKGINSILGDEKIMSILSLVTNQLSSANSHITPNAVGHYRQDEKNHYNNSYQNTDYGTRQEMSYKQHALGSYSNNHEQVKSDYTEPPPYQRYEGNYTKEDYTQNIKKEPYYDGHNINMPSRNVPPSPRSNITSSRPLLPQQNSNDYSHGGYERRDVIESIKSLVQPAKPKWIDEPLFTPSIIVDYEHKCLRLKARGFIEPVHMFDYNHKSKDGESTTQKDFEREVDGLFTRKPRRTDINDEWNNFLKHSDRRPLRDDQRDRSKLSHRDDHMIFNRRSDNPYEERRRDDRDRILREDFTRRERVPEYDRSRDLGRERDYGRDRDFGRDFGRERDPLRDRDLGRDREFGRDRDLGRDRDMGRDRELLRDRNIGKERDLGRDRDMGRDRDSGRYRDFRKDDSRNRSRSRERDTRKREHSKDSLDSSELKRNRESTEATPAQSDKPQHIVMIDDILEPPGRDMRPDKIVIILRGPPGSGKSYLAKLIRDKEAEHGGTVRIMSIDDYFMQEGEVEEKDPTTGKVVKKPSLKYEYDEQSEEAYLSSLKRAFKRTLTDGYFTFLIYDSVNEQLKSYADVWNFSRQNGFQVYICTMDIDAQTCYKRNIHGRSLEDIETIVSRFFPTPAHHIHLDATTLLQSASIPDVQMEDADDVTMEDAQQTEVDSSFTSKWEKVDDAAQLARLDGTSKPLRSSQLSMEDYLQLDDWTPTTAKPGKKAVRWADIEERREQEKMRAIGFVVGQTDWNRMTDPTMGSSALTQTKYIERVKRF